METSVLALLFFQPPAFDLGVALVLDTVEEAIGAFRWVIKLRLLVSVPFRKYGDWPRDTCIICRQAKKRIWCVTQWGRPRPVAWAGQLRCMMVVDGEILNLMKQRIIYMVSITIINVSYSSFHRVVVFEGLIKRNNWQVFTKWFNL